ncbi:MAG TPA: 16S rRNA (guanine(527)-N(7))-methyltransferase RsmG [Ferruginibacter sp.]|nr:16S rRNA (guanine(527)-N(7))-methyltransferase RsmG [Bacteroidota bacterium]MBS1925523.1 16S rRNA (guanine(527)-N(7))-methyltransferase RsmG [Bacteroidota bacterium]MCC6692717.1 16S rRNA (guanine(527)-N(7))-methyltransferase RsmG [Chitinophagaceae bacterium]HMT96538.1 16S rRNA (guanine(527)-N(7))-methyltransferase RsmG [Ferruginibacter sp.]HMU23513.1 16S rRNA (guanine(527)-N(7))-methyltransferase RsmG [Ferruginibacter sp.]
MDHSIVQKYFTDFSEKQLQQLTALKALYEEWNAKINVISRKDMDHFYLHHVLHSLAIATQFRFTKEMTVMDLGTGGGFPGLPLAIFFPEVQFLLVDSINKKLNVIKEVSQATGINNLSTLHSRAEDIQNKKFDVIVSRAVAPLKDLWKWSKPLLRKNKTGQTDAPNGLICLKGGDLAQEIHESLCKPYVWELEKIFAEDFFVEKYMLYVPLR